MVRSGDAVALPASGAAHGFRAVRRRLAIAPPGGGPHRRGQDALGVLLAHQGADARAQPLQEGPDGPEVRRASGVPRWAVRRAPPGWHEAVDGGWEPTARGQLWSTPRLPSRPPTSGGGCGALGAGRCRGPQADVVPRALGVTAQRPSRWRQGEDDVTGGAGEARRPPFLPPRLGLRGRALGTTAVATGVVDSGLLAPGLTRPSVPSQALRATVEPSRERAPMPRAQGFPEPLQGGRASRPPAGRHLRQVRARRAERAARRALTAPWTASHAWGVRGVSRAVVLGMWWPRSSCMTRRDTPPAHRGVAEAWRRRCPFPPAPVGVPPGPRGLALRADATPRAACGVGGAACAPRPARAGGASSRTST